MTWGTAAVLAVIAAAVIAAVVKIVRDKKAGKSSCGCDCSSCGACSSSCGGEKDTKKES